MGLNRKYCLLLVIFSFSAYLNSFINPFIWDDLSLIFENPNIKNFKFMLQYFYKDIYLGPSNFYRPFQMITYASIYKLFKLNPVGYHLLNIFLHTGCAILFFILLKEIYGERISFLASLLWAVHPINTEAITYISGTADPLFLFWGLFGIYFYYIYLQFSTLTLQKGNKRKNIFLFFTYICFIFSLLSKETAVLILLLFFLYLYSTDRLNKNEIKNYILISLIFIIYFLLRQTILNFGKIEVEEKFINRFYTGFRAFLIYISILLFPFILSMERHIPYIKTAKNIDFVIGFVYFLLFFLFLYRKRKDKKILFAGSLFILNFLFHSNIIIPLNGNLREHWMYLGGIGFFIYFVIGLNMIKKEKIKLVLIIFIFSLYGIRTILRNYDWKDPEKFYLKSISVFPESPRLWTNLGHLYIKKGDYDKAIKCFEKAYFLKPNCIEPLVGLGSLYYLKGDIEISEKIWEKVIKQSPQEPSSYLFLGLIYKKKGDYKKSFEYLLTSIKIHPGFSISYYFLGKFFLEIKDYKNAEIFFKKGIETDPLDPINFNSLGIINSEYKKDYFSALSFFYKAYTLNPKDTMYIFNIAKMYQILNKHKEAIFWYEKGLAMSPDNLLALNDLAISYAIIGEKEKAKNIFKEILKKDKNFKPAIDNLKLLERVK